MRRVAAAEQAVCEAFMDLWRQPHADDDTTPLVVRLLAYLQSRDIANPS